MSTIPPRQNPGLRGFGLISALMVTLLIGGLAVMLARMTATQAVSYGLDDRGVRAYWAARAGLEWASYMVTPPGALPAGCPALGAGVLALPAASLSEYRVTVTCSDTAGVGPYLLVATACAQDSVPPGACGAPSSPTYVERVVTRTIP